jgi:hypothetical protein
LNRMQNTKHCCSRASPSHSWNRLIYKLLIVSPNSAKNLNTKSLGSSLTIQRWHIKVIFVNTTWPLGEIPDRNKICHRNISKWMLYWSRRATQTVAELSDCNNFELNIFTLVIYSCLYTLISINTIVHINMNILHHVNMHYSIYANQRI